jgi:tetratricopeptide (TPR) repeat protein
LVEIARRRGRITERRVADPDQVTAVLPRGVGGHRALITSRNTLAALPEARLLDLHVLDPAAAVELLALGLRRRHPADTRVVADPAAAARLVELCGWLPLAVQIVAALLGDEPDRPLADLAAELADEGHRLRALDYGGRWAVRAAFDLSYRRLDPATAHLFRLLAAAPGPDVGLGVAAVLADQPEPATRAGLRRLCRAHLLDQLPAPPGLPGPPGQESRWRMHDLIRLYAAEQLTPDQRAAAFTRVLDHYRRTADLAQRRFTALPAVAAAVPVGFDTPAQAMAWVLAERAGLISHITQATDTRPTDAVWLAADLAPFLERARLLADWVTIATAAVQASRDDRTLAAASWNNLGAALRQVRRFEEAITAHQRAGELFRETGDRHGEAMAWNNLGLALRQVRRFEEAITAHQRAGELFRETEDRHGEGTAWNNLGLALVEARRFEEAITAHYGAVEIFRETGDRHGEAMAWNNLGLALQQVRQFEEATTAHQRAVEIFRETGDRHGEAMAWNNLGNVLRQVRRFEEAITALERGGRLYRETGDRHGEGTAWNNLGNALVEVGRFEEAITAFERDVVICAELGDHYGQARTLANLGQLHAYLDDPHRARRAWTDAAALFTAAGAEDDAARLRRWIVDLDDA